LASVPYGIVLVRVRVRKCCIIPPIFPRCPETQSASMFIQTNAPQVAPRVEPEFPLSLWIRVRRDMLARMVTVSGYRGPGALKPLRRYTTRAKPNLLSFNLEVGNLEPQDTQGWSRAHPARPARTVSSSSRQAPFELLKGAYLALVISQRRRTGSRGPSSSNPGCVHVRPPVRDDDGAFDPPLAPPPPPPPPPPER